MIIAVPRETAAGEKRVATVPNSAAALIKEGHEVRIERDAGLAAGFTNQQYTDAGASVCDGRADLIAAADVIAQVRTVGADPSGSADLQAMRRGQFVVGFADPLASEQAVNSLAERGVTLLAMDLIPRITRAQSMDALSSQANLAGYKAVTRAADMLGKIFPMMMTAAGTIQPTKVFIIGAGVAGLQAIATAKRLGAVVSAFDVRAAVKEQVESLGGKFVQLPLDTAGAEDKGGYAKAQSEEQLRRQQELMARVIAESDVVITTALVPGKRSPVLVTRAMVEAMPAGAIIVDLAAEKGGNCELTRPGETITHNGVTIIGDENLSSAAAYHASQLYANNVVQLLKHLFKKGAAAIDLSDEIAAGVAVTQGGEVIHPRVREALANGGKQ